MDDEELPEVSRRIDDLVREAGWGWVLDQVRAAEGPGGDDSPRGRLRRRLRALERAVGQTVAVERGILDDLPEVMSIAFKPEPSAFTHGEARGHFVDRRDVARRAVVAQRVVKILRQLRRQVDDIG